MRYPPPADYLRQIEPTLRLHLFADPAALLRLLGHYHPGVTADHISDWRMNYRLVAPLDDRNNMNIMEEERVVLVEEVQRLDDAGTPARKYRKHFDTLLRRPGFTRSRAISAGTWAPSSTNDDRHAWTLQEDLALLAGKAVRTLMADHNRRRHLDDALTPSQVVSGADTPQEPEVAATPPTEPVTAPPEPDRTPGPAATVGLGGGVSAVVLDDLTEVSIQFGHAAVNYTKEQLATVVSRLVMVHDLMEEEA